MREFPKKKAERYTLFQRKSAFIANTSRLIVNGNMQVYMQTKGFQAQLKTEMSSRDCWKIVMQARSILY